MNKEMNSFFEVPKFRELLLEEAESFGLIYNSDNGEFIMEPSWSGTHIVWAAGLRPNTPTYNLYNLGTNALTVLKYTPEEDKWSKIDIKDIDDLYGIVWKILCKLDKHNTKKITCWKHYGGKSNE